MGDIKVFGAEETQSDLLVRDTREAGKKKNRKTNKKKNNLRKNKNKKERKMGKSNKGKARKNGKKNKKGKIRKGKKGKARKNGKKNKKGKIRKGKKGKARKNKKGRKNKNRKIGKGKNKRGKGKNGKNGKNRRGKNKGNSRNNISQMKIEKRMKKSIENKNTVRKKEEKFSHCQYLDLTEIGLRNDSACESGGKFLFKAQKGHRRQFLMTNTSNIAVFLKHRHKITNCTDLEDITARVKCKAVTGTKSLNISSPVGGCMKTCAKTAITPGGAGSPGGPEFINNKPAAGPGNALQLGSSTTVYCPCPEKRTFICTTKVESRANMHKITCNNMAEVTIMCGSDLYGRKTVLGVGIDWYKHPLCTTKEYKSLLIY